jgi:three-Cys-motif partner protein
MTKTLFEEQSEESRIKAEIVEKYFYAWSRVIAKNSREKTISYIDLFAGPGRYKDGSASVPVMITQRAINDDYLRESLVSFLMTKMRITQELWKKRYSDYLELKGCATNQEYIIMR